MQGVLSFIENLYFDILTSMNTSDRISVVSQEGVDTMSYKEDVRMIKALADENRLRILKCLHHGEKCACVILEELSITQSTLSHHMKILCDCGLVDSRKDGRWMHYSISEEGKNRFKDMFSHYLETTDSDGVCSCGKCE